LYSRMRRYRSGVIILLVIFVSVLASAGAEISDCYQARAVFTVTMPQLDDDVIYEIDLFQQPNPSDSLLGFDYLISWRPRSHRGAAEGFSAYFSGNHYRYSANRLQEYHFQVDSVPFCMGQNRNNGVHRSAQFVNLLPSVISGELRAMSVDSAYSCQMHADTIISGQHRRVLDAVMRVNGALARESEYVFDSLTGMPVRIRMENNPGSITEQSVWVDYDTLAFIPCGLLNEERLITLFPDAFGRYRQSTFRIDNLPGSPLPAFSLPTIDFDRYSRRASDGFRTAALVVLLSVSDGFTAQMIDAIRRGADMMPYPAEVIWAFTDNHADSIREIIGRQRAGEHILMNAESLARDCGVSTPPALLMVDSGGIVRYVSVGYNNDITSDVIQKMTLLSE
nr:hypothetical protein [Paramuribaculum sp.]